MWKKEGTPDYPGAATRAEVPPPPPARPEPAPVPDRSAPPKAATRDRATIGRSITIRGEVTGDEDLLIQGRVDGSVNLKQHAVTVGAEGEVKANVIARVVTVEGSVEGNVNAEEQIILRSSARVQGDISSPRVVLEDGARFRGGVDMGESLERGGRSEAAPRASAGKTSESGRTLGTAEPTQKELSASADEPKSASSRTAEASHSPATR